MNRMTKPMRWVVVVSLFLILNIIGCSRRPGQRIMKVSKLGFSMKLPSGWQQGRLLRGEKKFALKPDGRYFFPSTTERYPYGCLVVLSRLPKTLSLNQYATGMVCGQLLSKRERTLSGFEALEIVEEDFDRFAPAEMLPISIIHLYIRKEEKIIWVSFWSLEEDFDEYESSIRESLDSIKLK